MKKHILTALGLFAACTMSATQYMHINLQNGNGKRLHLRHINCPRIERKRS